MTYFLNLPSWCIERCIAFQFNLGMFLSDRQWDISLIFLVYSVLSVVLSARCSSQFGRNRSASHVELFASLFVLSVVLNAVLSGVLSVRCQINLGMFLSDCMSVSPW